MPGLKYSNRASEFSKLMIICNRGSEVIWNNAKILAPINIKIPPSRVIDHI